MGSIVVCVTRLFYDILNVDEAEILSFFCPFLMDKHVNFCMTFEDLVPRNPVNWGG